MAAAAIAGLVARFRANLTNTDVVTSYNERFVPGGSWLTPTGIQPARYAKANVQVDF